ncbi:GGDEF domain-containing protein [Eubacterium sp.]|uniref:GGDEF domain-containing protein n=1 Tax=Eubacterium sp. TaxID=142586 RepID=UPI0025D64E3D|nr:GGDEF domain-containing protein [Eubacterium sp.]MCR5628532.1 GGDEF domain-containing protein [Eubacterium sp.]
MDLIEGMSKEKVFNIGVMIGNVHTQHPMELIRGISEAAKSENVNISFFVGAQGNALDFWEGDEDDYNSYNYQYNSLYDYSLIAGLDAIIISYGTLCIYLENENREEFAKKYRSVPLVILEEYDEDSCDSFIISDNFGSMYNIVEHLLSDHGYKRIVYLSGPINNTDSNERERAYLEAMKAHGLEVTSEMVEYGDYSSNVDDLVEKLLDNNEGVEAIVSANDEMAISIYNVCRRRGLVPGRDIAVTGYDDVEFAQRMDPPLTTANQDGLDMGYRALKCAVSLCKDPTKPIKMKIPAKFLKRQSCGCKIHHVDKELELVDVLEKIKDSSDKERIKEAVSLATVGSYKSVVSEEGRNKGKAYFEFLISKLLELDDLNDDKKREIADSLLLQVQNLCADEGCKNIEFSGFLRSFQQIMRFFMEREKETDVLVLLGRILELTDNYVTSFVMRKDEEDIMMLLTKSWAAPTSIKYMIDKADDENAFNCLAIETAIDQGAKSAYLYLLPEPLKCDRKMEFVCPDCLELVAKHTNGKVEVYDMGKRPVVTKENGFASLFPDSSKHSYVVFLLFAKEYQYGIMLCEIDDTSIGMLYGVSLQISTALAYMQISKQENEAKQQLFDTLKELRDKNEMLSFVSSMDALTGIYNRRGFIENVVDAINENVGKKAALFFSDLDHLKQINDEFGHQDGDFALMNAAKIMKETFDSFGSENAVCGRIGGDEFVSFMICDEEDDTEKVLEELKLRCKLFNEKCDKPYYVEFSTGCYTFVCRAVFSVAELTGKADECLYEAKKTRRDNIVK